MLQLSADSRISVACGPRTPVAVTNPQSRQIPQCQRNTTAAPEKIFLRQGLQEGNLKSYRRCEAWFVSTRAQMEATFSQLSEHRRRPRTFHELIAAAPPLLHRSHPSESRILECSCHESCAAHLRPQLPGSDTPRHISLEIDHKEDKIEYFRICTVRGI
jgi:hypothetical protein